MLKRIHDYKVTGVVEKTTCCEPYVLGKGAYKVALYDFGAKKNIARELVNRNCEVTVFPADTPAKTILEGHFDGIMLSNGPGDPEECVDIIENMKILSQSGLPIFAICLGHQLMALAHGFQTEKMTYGHHGANHPVKDLSTNRVVKEESLDSQMAKMWFQNVNDGTLEGIEYLQEPIKTVQFHPEASAGPLDTSYLFDEFIKMMGGNQNA